VVLLLACANVASFLLASSVVRCKEVAIRKALGASRLRILRQSLTEILLLGSLGGLAGLLLANWTVRLVPVLIPSDLTVPLPASFGMDQTMLLFAIGILLMTGMLSGIFPAFEASRIALVESLKEGTSASLRRKRHFSGLVILETALCLVLVALSGLLIKSFLNLQSVDLGFKPQNLLTMRMIPLSLHGKPHEMIGFYRELLERVEHLPGIISASVVSQLPGTDSELIPLGLEGYHTEAEALGEMQASWRFISPGYFRTLGIPFLRGREFTPRDTWESPGVLIINQTMARLYWSGEDPVGKRVRRQYPEAPWLTVVGVVGDVGQFGMEKERKPQAYLPFEQSPIPPMSLAVRSAVAPESVLRSIQTDVWQMNKKLPLFNVSTMEKLAWDSTWQPRFNMMLFSLFAGLALLLAVIGLYSVISYTVAQRTHEMGIRIALGAKSNDVLQLVIFEAMRLVLIGLAVGSAGILALNRTVSSLLYELSPTDPGILFGVALLLTLTALLACYIPARRAAEVDPMVALRYE
jgi:putative ABC transport system permease protein